MTSDRDSLAGEIRRRAARLFANSDREHETCSYEAADILLYRGISMVPLQDGPRLDEVDRVIWECTSFPGDEAAFDEDDLIDVSVSEDADGIHLSTRTGEVTLDVKQALAAVNLLSSALCHTLMAPWSEDDPSSILSRGQRTPLKAVAP